MSSANPNTNLTISLSKKKKRKSWTLSVRPAARCPLRVDLRRQNGVVMCAYVPASVRMYVRALNAYIYFRISFTQSVCHRNARRPPSRLQRLGGNNNEKISLFRRAIDRHIISGHEIGAVTCCSRMRGDIFRGGDGFRKNKAGGTKRAARISVCTPSFVKLVIF